MECREIDDKKNKCQCKTCSNMKNCYCVYFKSNHMCEKCGWKGFVTMCPNKKEQLGE